jgi:hypothetical protein
MVISTRLGTFGAKTLALDLQLGPKPTNFGFNNIYIKF